jgi:inner membrane protein
VAGIATLALAPRLPGIRRPRFFCCLFLATASHGVLDAMTNGGLGVAFLAPFDRARYFLPFRPIQVSPLGIPSDAERMLRIARSELTWVWLPTLLVTMVLETRNRLMRKAG